MLSQGKQKKLVGSGFFKPDQVKTIINCMNGEDKSDLL